MYTSIDQTAKMIELGFEKPKSIIDKYYDYDAEAYKEVNHYSIGELIEMLPKTITHEIWWGDDKDKEGIWGLRIDTGETEYGWDVSYERDYSAHLHLVGRSELIDALFYMVVKLKEEGVI